MGNGYGGALVHGDKGTIMFGAHGATGVRIIPETKMQAYDRPPATLARSKGHHAEWIDACKGRGTTGSNFDYAGPLTETVLLGNIAIRTGDVLHFDPQQMAFKGNTDADQWLRRENRTGW
jgi:hypothetical protein